MVVPAERRLSADTATSTRALTATTQSARELVLKGTVAGWLQYAVALIVTLVLTPFVLDTVGPGAYGVWLVLTQAIGYSGLLDLGTQPGVMRYVAEASALGNREELRRVIGTALRFYIGSAVVCLFLGLLLVVALPYWFDLGNQSVSVVRHTAAIAALAAAVGLPAAAITGTLKGLQRFDLASALGIASNAVRAGATVVALKADLGLPGLAGAALSSNIVALVVGAAILQRQTGVGVEVLTAGSRSTLGRLLTVGAYSIIGTAGWHLAYGSDTLVVAAKLRAVDAAHFGLAASILVMLSALMGAFTGTLLPLASASSLSPDPRRLQLLYLLGTRTTLTLALPVMALLFAEGPALLSLWLGPEVGQPSGAILRLLVIAYLPSVVNGVGLPFALGMGLHKWAGIALLSEGILKICLSLLWIDPLGTSGVALGTLVASATHQCFLWPLVLCRRLALQPVELWRKALRSTLAPAVVLAAVLFYLDRLTIIRSPIWHLVVATMAVALLWAPVVSSLLRQRAVTAPSAPQP